MCQRPRSAWYNSTTTSMKPALPLLPALAAALFLPGCQLLPGSPDTPATPAAIASAAAALGIIADLSFSRPVGPEPRGTLPAPTGAAKAQLLTRVPDAHFAHYAEDASLQDLLQRLDALAEEIPNATRHSAQELAQANPSRGDGPAQWFSEEEALAQEEQYLALSQPQRLALATQAMKALLASPARPDDIFPEYRLHSFHQLNVEQLRGAVGGYMGRTLLKEPGGNSVAQPSQDQWLSHRNSETAAKRLMARAMLEEVAANRTLPAGTRCAAIHCLQHIYTEYACHDDGGRDLAYLVSALPRRGALPTLLSLGDMRFCHDDSHFAAAARLAAFMKSQPRATEQTAEELTHRSDLVVRPPQRDPASGLLLNCSPTAFLKEQDLLRAEQQYKALSPQQRRALAKEVLFAHLTQPLTPCHSEMWGQTQRLRSYDELNVETIRRKAGGIFAEDHPHATTLFKRMVARLLLEEPLAERSVLSSSLQHAAIESLQHLCRESLADADGGYPLAYVTDALPSLPGGLEEALFGGRAWTSPTE